VVSRFQVAPVVFSTIRMSSSASQQSSTCARIRSSRRWCGPGAGRLRAAVDLVPTPAAHPSRREPLHRAATADHYVRRAPWNWAAHEQGERTPRKNETSRWNAGKDRSFTPLRPERVVEVRYDYMEGQRFRHTARFVRWRLDRDPESCIYEQLERPVRFDLADVPAS
jgi:hypothetical protein